MVRLLRKPFGIHGKVHEITPSSAGWRYVGFSLWRLRVGETVSEATGDREVILVMVEGKARLAAAGRDWGVLGQRMNVFDKTPPHCLYLPSGAEWQAVAETPLRRPKADTEPLPATYTLPFAIVGVVNLTAVPGTSRLLAA